MPDDVREGYLRAETEQQRRLATIMFTDMVGYSALAQKDEALALVLLDEQRALLRAAFAEHGGREIEAVGDGFFVEFPSALAAARCAVAIQQRLAERNSANPSGSPIRVRIGLHVGDVVARDNRVHGDAVNIAARIEPLAPPGGICVSEDVARQIQNKIDLPLIKLGKGELKNIQLPVDIYRIVLPGKQRLLSLPERVAFAFHRKRTRRTVAAGTALLVILAIAGALTWQLMRSRAPVEDPVLALPKGSSIAVLPFTNLSGDPGRDYFSDGITEEIITELTRFRNLRVIARNSTFKYKGRAVDVRQVGRELGATFVLEGSIRPAGDTIRVTAQLLDARHGGHLWAETYERKLTAADVFEVQDDVTQRVVGAVGGAYGALSRATLEESKRKATASFDAYECVLRTYEYWRVVAEPEHLKVRECLERSVELDPNYADAWALLSMIYVEEYQQGFNRRPDPLGRGHDAARRAINLDPNHQRAHAALAIVAFFRRDLDAFISLAERAVALNPNYEDIVAYMGTLIVYGSKTNPARQARGLALVKKAMALNPAYPSWYHFPAAWVHWQKGEYVEALAEAQKVDLPDYFWTHVQFILFYGALGRKADAQAAVGQLLKLRPDFPVKVREEYRKWNTPEEMIDRVIADLRRGGLNIPPGT